MLGDVRITEKIGGSTSNENRLPLVKYAKPKTRLKVGRVPRHDAASASDGGEMIRFKFVAIIEVHLLTDTRIEISPKCSRPFLYRSSGAVVLALAATMLWA